MKSAVFNTAKESYQVSKVIYVGPIVEIAEEKRKGASTHFFKLTTSTKSAYCYYKGIEAARKAHGALMAMVRDAKKHLFQHGSSLFDTREIISFGNVFGLATPQENKTHTFIVNLNAVDERNTRIWLKYTSEEKAKNGQRALFCAIQAANDMPWKSAPSDESEKKQESPVGQEVEMAAA
ncbi:MAG: hypothetical protein GF398_06365 [Chitinivibrionales bacterium]|nr:hypothetical protein [Chitinivibrionales bacterium]